MRDTDPTDVLSSIEQRHFSRVGRYVMCGEIALGGAASVHLARVAGPGGFVRLVVIKRLHPHLARSPEHVMMFLDEARLTARIRHLNVVSPIDVVIDRQEPFMVMDYIDGVTLGELLSIAYRRREFVAVDILASVLLDVLRGLQAAHDARSEHGEPLEIVHRDVSPSNIIVGCDGISRVLDFGIAKAQIRASTTREGQLKGKLGYLAPEQLTGGQVDRRADVFTAAVVFWEALTMSRLFGAATDAEVTGRTLHMEIPPPSSINPAVPPELDLAILRALNRHPAARFQSAEEFGHAIERATRVGTVRTVGKWVTQTGAEALARRARLLDEVERSLDDCQRLPEEETPNVTGLNQLTTTAPPATMTLAPTSSSGRRFSLRWVGYALAPVALGIYVMFSTGIMQRNNLEHASIEEAAATAPAEVQPDPEPEPSSQAPQPMIVRSQPEMPATIATTTPELQKPKSKVTTPERASRRPAPRVVKARPRPKIERAPKPNCDPPFAMDMRGIRRIKPGCL